MAKKKDTYRVRWGNGAPTKMADSYEEAQAIVRAEYPNAEIGHDGDLEGFGDRTLFWKCAADSIDDDGARAIGQITRDEP